MAHRFVRCSVSFQVGAGAREAEIRSHLGSLSENQPWNGINGGFIALSMGNLRDQKHVKSVIEAMPACSRRDAVAMERGNFNSSIFQLA